MLGLLVSVVPRQTWSRVSLGIERKQRDGAFLGSAIILCGRQKNVVLVVLMQTLIEGSRGEVAIGGCLNWGSELGQGRYISQDILRALASYARQGR